jgi:hypothetical protein
MGVVEAVNGNIKSLLRRGRGHKNLHYLLLKAQRMAVTKTEFVAFEKASLNALIPEFLLRAQKSLGHEGAWGAVCEGWAVASRYASSGATAMFAARGHRVIPAESDRLAATEGSWRLEAFRDLCESHAPIAAHIH